MTTSKERQRIEELLPFWVNGTLTEDEREAVAAAIGADADLDSEVAFLKDVKDAVRSKTIEPSPGEFGYARLRRDLGLDRRRAAGPTRQSLQYGLLAASAAFAMAGGVALYMAQDREPVFIQASDGGAGPVLTVEFQPEATVAQISRLLLEHDLVIVDGPSALRLYRIDVLDGDDMSAAAASLRAMENIVAFVEVTE